MALLHFDGFDMGDNALIYNTLSGTSTTSTSTRFGTGRSLQLGNAATTVTLATTAAATFHCGFAYNASSSSSSALLSFWGDGNVTEHGRLAWTSPTTLAAQRTGTTLASATVSEPVGSWLYIEVMYTIADAGGRFRVKIDGSTVIDFTGDTRQSGTVASTDAIRLLTPLNVTRLFDDLYVCDGTGSAPHNDNLGPVRVYALSPSGAGTETTMTPSAGSNYQCVDELPYSTADFVTGSTTQRDTYAMADLPGTPGTIFGVMPTIVASKTDAGALSLKTAVRSGGTVYTGTATALSTSEGSIRTIRTTDPATSAAWTASGVNSLEAGAEVV